MITGASGVFGHWVADEFAGCGTSQIVVVDRDTELVRRSISAGRWEGTDVEVVEADLVSEEGLKRLEERVASLWGAPDVIVNCMGYYPTGRLLEIDVTEWRRVMDANVDGVYLTVRTLAALMIAEGRGGAIVNFHSGAAKVANVGTVPYSVAKAALSMLTRGLALELAEYAIRVNGVVPGVAQGSAVTPLTDEYVRWVEGVTPLGRLSGPKDAAKVVAYLASSDAAFVTGATWTVDGGLSAGPVAIGGSSMS